jgi:hypothetical protein
MRTDVLYSRVRKAFLDSIETQRKAIERQMNRVMRGATAKQRRLIIQRLMTEFEFAKVIQTMKPVQRALEKRHLKAVTDELTSMVKEK